MAEYKVFEDGITTSAISPFLEGGFIGSKQRKEILEKYGIGELVEGKDYDLQSFLHAFKELGETVGEMNLFLIGKSVMEKVEFPPMDSLEQALRSVDVAYHMNHKKRGKVMFDPSSGQMEEGIGHYSVTKYDETSKTAVMVCNTPYPSKFEEGLILQITRKFKPKGSLLSKVELDQTKESRRAGGETCTFNISW